MSHLVTDYYDYYLILVCVNSEMNKIYEMLFTHNTFVFIIFFWRGVPTLKERLVYTAYLNLFYYFFK